MGNIFKSMNIVKCESERSPTAAAAAETRYALSKLVPDLGIPCVGWCHGTMRIRYVHACVRGCILSGINSREKQSLVRTAGC